MNIHVLDTYRSVDDLLRMCWIHSVFLGFVFFLDVSKVVAIELHEVEFPTQHVGLLSKWLSKRKTDYSGLDLKDSEVFLWQGKHRMAEYSGKTKYFQGQLRRR